MAASLESPYRQVRFTEQNMSMQVSGVIKDYTVFNPDFYGDVVRFIGLNCTGTEAEAQVTSIDASNPLSPEQRDAGELSLKERLNAMVDRLEFIKHLDLLSRFAEESGFVVLGQEVKGIQWDIRALRLYLSLTCIDIFRPSNATQRTHFETTFANLEGKLAATVQTQLSLRKADGKAATMAEMGLFFYNVRNFYTHTGRRFHIVDCSPLAQESVFHSGSKNKKEEQYLMVSQGVDLIDILVQIAIALARRRFGWRDGEQMHKGDG
jgi:hypothetical protein